uniref:Aamy domain-containing protein n=1 Tax=Macrostomum lignano TaxID=282301 RepID=A0A1I8F5Z9_9PLAT
MIGVAALPGPPAAADTVGCRPPSPPWPQCPAPRPTKKPQLRRHNRHVVVHLFEWRWNDIANECERFLGPYGYCGVQALVERYQPVSYILVSRSGNEQEFKNMVENIYVDAVNQPHGGRGRQRSRTAGSYYDSGRQDFPGVPTATGTSNGRGQCSTASLNHRELSRPGAIAGFRIDAAKHMWPDHLRGILGRVNNLNSRLLRHRQEALRLSGVIDLGVSDQELRVHPDRQVTEFNYGAHLTGPFSKEHYPLKTCRTSAS